VGQERTPHGADLKVGVGGFCDVVRLVPPHIGLSSKGVLRRYRRRRRLSLRPHPLNVIIIIIIIASHMPQPYVYTHVWWM
jgi:hypothetical protein